MPLNTDLGSANVNVKRSRELSLFTFVFNDGGDSIDVSIVTRHIDSTSNEVLSEKVVSRKFTQDQISEVLPNINRLPGTYPNFRDAMEKLCNQLLSTLPKGGF